MIRDPLAPASPPNQDLLAARLGETIGLALANKLNENMQSNPGLHQLSANQPIHAPVPEVAVDTYHRDWLRKVTDDRAKFQESTIRDLIGLPDRIAAVPPVSGVQQPRQPAATPAATPATHGCKEASCDCEFTIPELRQDYPNLKAGDVAECCGHKLSRHAKL